jgi:hypothetical protein
LELLHHEPELVGKEKAPQWGFKQFFVATVQQRSARLQTALNNQQRQRDATICPTKDRHAYY